MSTAIAERNPDQGGAVATRRTEADTVRAALEKMKPQFLMALPRHLTPDRLLRVAMTAIQNTPKLLECDRTSLFSAIMTCAQLGLEPDGVLGQAYLVPFAGKVQFIPGYKGLIALARNSGDVSSIQAHEVREGDLFEFDFASGEAPRHRFDLRQERGEVIAFYAIARFKDGAFHFDVMTRAEVDAIRDASKGYQSSKRYAKNGVIDSPWSNHYVEMGKKTVVRRIAKYLPMNVQKAAAIADNIDAGRHAALDVHGDVVIEGETHEQADPSRQITAGGSKLDRFEEQHEAEPTTDEDGVVTEGTLPAMPKSPLTTKRAADWMDWTDAACANIRGLSDEGRAEFMTTHAAELKHIRESRNADQEQIQAALDEVA